MPNVEGSGQKKIKLLSTVVVSKLLYASPIWATALVFNCNVKTLLRPQRKIDIRTAMAYHTISTEAVIVIAVLIPLHLLELERAERYKRRHEPDTKRVSKDTHVDVLSKWQEE